MNNLAARAGRWSASHWKTAVIGWIVFMIAAFSLTMLVQKRDMTDAEASTGNSRVAAEIIAKGGFPERSGESVIVQHPGLRADDPPFVAVVGDVAARLQGTANVEDLQAPLGHGAAGLIAKDGHSALINFQIPGSESQTSERVRPILDQVRSLQRAHPGYVIEEFGAASANRELDATVGADLRRAEQLSVPITPLVLVVAFGALVAASIPVVLAFTAVLATYGLSALISHLIPDGGEVTSSVILLIGMAVGVDYSLFYLRREREEVAAGRDRASALRVAAGTSGQAVLISGATVIVAMAGMLLAGDATFSSIAVNTMAVVRAGHPAGRADPRDRRQARWRAGRRRRGHRRHQGLQPTAARATPAGVRLRARPGLPAAAGDLPLDRDPHQVDPAQPAQRGRQLRRAGGGVPARLGVVIREDSI